MGRPVDIDLEVAEMNKAIDRLMALNVKQKKRIVIEAGEAFILSAVKVTDPARGKSSIPVKMYKREIIKITDPRYPNKTSRTRYKVPYRTVKKRGRKYFSKKSEAKKFARIKFRGIGRAGFFMALPKISKKLTSAHRKILQRSPRIFGKQINIVSLTQNNDSAQLKIINQAEGIGNYAKYAEAQGYRKAKNRLNAYARELEKEMKIAAG